MKLSVIRPVLLLYVSLMVGKTWTTVDQPPYCQYYKKNYGEGCKFPTAVVLKKARSFESSSIRFYTTSFNRKWGNLFNWWDHKKSDAGRLTDALFLWISRRPSIPCLIKNFFSILASFGFVENSIAWFTHYLSNRAQVEWLGINLSSPLESGKRNTSGKHWRAGVVRIVY